MPKKKLHKNVKKSTSESFSKFQCRIPKHIIKEFDEHCNTLGMSRNYMLTLLVVGFNEGADAAYLEEVKKSFHEKITGAQFDIENIISETNKND